MNDIAQTLSKVIAHPITMLVGAVAVAYFVMWHTSDKSHPGLALASELETVQEQMVTKGELEEAVQPLTRGIKRMDCGLAEILLNQVRSEVTYYELKENRSWDDNKALEAAKDKEHDLEITRNNLCK